MSTSPLVINRSGVGGTVLRTPNFFLKVTITEESYVLIYPEYLLLVCFVHAYIKILV